MILRRVSLSLLFVAISVFLLLSSLAIDTKGAAFAVSPRFVPFGLSIVMMGLALRALFQDFRSPDGPAGLDGPAWRSILGFGAVVAGYLALMGTVNFHLLTFGFLMAAFFYLGVRSLPRMALVAASLVASEYLIFEYAFHVRFP